MRLRLLDIIVCPTCGDRFDLKVERQEMRDYDVEWRERIAARAAPFPDAMGGGRENLWTSYRTEILSGQLLCKRCGTEHAIEQGIPRILSQELRTIAGRKGRGGGACEVRIRGVRDQAEAVRKEEDPDAFRLIQMANQSNYGYEWKTFSHEYDAWGANYRQYYVREEPEFFQGKLGLDAGCGNGRYTMPAAKNGAEMIGLDLSNAIEVAYEKGRDVPTFHAIQGDIFNLPFRDGTFDFAQSLGVIHISPDPEGALLSIKSKVRPGGKLFVYVYTSFLGENWLKYHLLRIVSLLRRLTVRLPSSVLYCFLYGMVPIVLATCYAPSWLLWHLPGGKGLSNRFPYSYQQYAHRRLRDIHMNLFDRFGNPVERRYSRQEMDAWLNRVGFESYVLDGPDGWVVAAVKGGRQVDSNAAA